MKLTVYEQLQNPLTRRRNDAHRARVLKLSPAIATAATPHYLALRRYLVNAPERFFNRAVHQLFFSWLRDRNATDRVALQQYMDDAAVEIGRALLFLSEISQEDWHDSLLDAVDEYELLRIIDRRIHRTYLRLMEGVLTPLTRIIAHFSRRDRAAGTEGLDIWGIVQELQAGPMASTAYPRSCSYKSFKRRQAHHGGRSKESFDPKSRLALNCWYMRVLRHEISQRFSGQRCNPEFLQNSLPQDTAGISYQFVRTPHCLIGRRLTVRA